MTDNAFIIGPRQTVDRALHPTLGEGRAVYGNGPAFFLPDEGEPVAARSIGLGGASSKPSRSWMTMTTPDGVTVELDTTKRARGDRHRRAWHPIHGAGWLVMLGRDVHHAIAMRFDPDEGRPFEMMVQVLSVGTPDYAQRSKRARTKAIKMTSEEEHWQTYELASGETIAFRDTPPGAETTKETRGATSDPAVVTRGAKVSVSPAEPRPSCAFPPPTATRAEVGAWLRANTRTP